MIEYFNVYLCVIDVKTDVTMTTVTSSRTAELFDYCYHMPKVSINFSSKINKYKVQSK